MTRSNAYNYGLARGREAAEFTDYDPSKDVSRSDAASESEQNSRQYGDFIHFSASINSSDNDEELWISYERGVEDGIKEYLSENNS